MKVLDRSTGEIIDNAESLPDQKPTAKQDNRSRDNQDFVMLYRHYVQQIADLGMKNPSALKVLLFLIRNMDNTNAIGVTQDLIADMTKLSRQTVSKAIHYLVKEGWMQIFKLGRANIYVVNPDVVWTSYADQKRYCKFRGTIMLSSEDNWQISRNNTTKVKQLAPMTINKIASAIEEAAADQNSGS